MNILIVNQSVIDMCASFFTLLTAVVEVDGTRMSSDSVYDQFVCRIWLTRMPLWDFLITSTYSFCLTAFERYTAVIYPVWYNNNVRTCVDHVSFRHNIITAPAPVGGGGRGPPLNKIYPKPEGWPVIINVIQ